MLTAADIANYALAANDLEPIASIDDGSDRAKQIRPIWKTVFESFLAEHGWSFATTRDVPARLKGDGGDNRLFRHAYALPGDCIKVVRVSGDCRRAPFEIKRFGDDGGGTTALFTDSERVVIEYVSNKTRIDDFSPPAREALGLRLAAEISLNTKNSNSRAQALLQRYQAALARALVNEDKTGTRPVLGGGQYSDARII